MLVAEAPQDLEVSRPSECLLPLPDEPALILASFSILLCHAASQLIACMIVLRAGRPASRCAQPALNECVFSATLHKNILFQFALMFSQKPAVNEELDA